MDGYVTDHIEILQDHSALFRSLAFFEEDLEKRCKMHKRRIDMLEPICNGTALDLFSSRSVSFLALIYVWLLEDRALQKNKKQNDFSVLIRGGTIIV